MQGGEVKCWWLHGEKPKQQQHSSVLKSNHNSIIKIDAEKFYSLGVLNSSPLPPCQWNWTPFKKHFNLATWGSAYEWRSSCANSMRSSGAKLNLPSEVLLLVISWTVYIYVAEASDDVVIADGLAKCHQSDCVPGKTSAGYRHRVGKCAIFLWKAPFSLCPAKHCDRGRFLSAIGNTSGH